MTTVPKNKLTEVRTLLKTGRKSRYALIQFLAEAGMDEAEATEYIDQLASEVYDAPTAEERQAIRQEHIQRENVGGYRIQMIIGGIILLASIGLMFSGYTLGLLSILGVILGVVILLYGLNIMLHSHPLH